MPRKRRFARLTFKEPIADQVTASHDVHILDLSLGGVRVEHTIVLRPGSTCHLRLPLKTANFSVICNVVWSRAVGLADAAWKGAGVLYHSGLEFSKLNPDARTHLVAYLEAHGTPPADRELTGKG
jgi:hypothetical protein